MAIVSQQLAVRMRAQVLSGKGNNTHYLLNHDLPLWPPKAPKTKAIPP